MVLNYVSEFLVSDVKHEIITLGCLVFWEQMKCDATHDCDWMIEI